MSFTQAQLVEETMMGVKTTKKRQRKRKENDWRRSVKPKSVERKNIEKWKKSGRRCGKKSETRYAKFNIVQVQCKIIFLF